MLAAAGAAAAGTVGYWRFEDGAFTSDSGANDYTMTTNGTVRQVAIGDAAEGTVGIPATVPGPGTANGFAASMVDEAGTTRQGYFSLGGTSDTFAPDTITVEAIVSLRTPIPGTSADGNAIASLWRATGNNRVWGLLVGNINGSIASTGGFQAQELAFMFATDGASFASRKVIGSGFTLTTGRTYYVAVTYRKPSVQGETDGLVKFWFQDLDGGTLLTSAAVTSDQMFKPTTEVPFQIGTLNLGDPLRWGGVIDEVRFSDAVVAPAQLLAKAGAYHGWAAAAGLNGTPGNEANFTDDADSDTIANGLEWILGGNPLTQDAAGLVTPQGDAATGLTLEFTRAKDSLAETTLAVRWDSGLDGTWPGQVAIGAASSGPDANSVTVAIDAAADPDLVTVLIPASNAPAGRVFARLEATQIP